MRSKIGVAVFLICAAIHHGALGDEQNKGGDEPAPTRSKATCDEIRQELERTSKGMAVPMKVAAGSWGKVPAELRKLPPGAELCGVDASLGQAIIKSPLFGKALESYYAPLFAKVGCKPLTCQIAKSGSMRQTRCSCDRPGGVGAVTTNVRNESFSLGTL